MTRPMEGARIAYAPGEAWCVAADRVVLVCERDLTSDRAAALHAQAASIATLEALRALVEGEPTALIALLDLDGSRALLRRHGVPATADGAPLPDRFGDDWSLDETGAAAMLAAGGLAALEGGALPLEGGVVRVTAVRVAPRPGDVPPDPAGTSEERATPEEAPATGAFGQALPPVASAEHRASRTPEPPEEAALEPARGDTGNPIGGLIDSVPGFIKPAAEVHLPEGAQVGPVRAAADAPATAEAAPAQAAQAPAPAPAAAELGDHDGETITADRARELLAERHPAEPAAATGPLVLSTLCPRGHVNAPGTLACAQCGAPVDERSAAQRRRPEVAVAALPSGERVPLGRGVVIGRRPRSRRVEDGRVPRLVTVESPNEDISRSHVELRVEDWNLVAVDLSSTNGTLLLREGAAPQRLRPEASTILQLGDRLDLGDGVVVAIEPISSGTLP